MEGQIYTEVDASVLNPGISTMAMISGNAEPSDGQTYLVVWIRWRYDNESGNGGYTGTSWYFNDSNNILVSEFPGGEEDFKQWLTTNKPTDLDAILSKWDAGSKAAFLNTNMGSLVTDGCLYFEGSN